MAHTSIDGVAVFWEPRAGRFEATLSFGCGTRDENLDTVGLSHYVLKAAMAAVGPTELMYVDVADARETRLAIAGPPDEVGAYLTALCAAISALASDAALPEVDFEPYDRSDNYWTVDPLRDPWASLHARRSSELDRWPAVDHRLYSPAEVAQYVRRYFTADNAAVGMTGAPPRGLRLPVPAGERVHHEPPVVSWPLGPQWYADEVTSPALSMAASMEASALLPVLLSRVTGALRRARLPYRASWGTAPVTADRFLLCVYLETRGWRDTARVRLRGRTHGAAGAELLWQQLRHLAEEPPTDAERDEVKRRPSVEDPFPDRPWFELGGTSRSVEVALFGGVESTSGTLDSTGAGDHKGEGLPALSSAAARVAATTFARTATIVVPPGVRPELPGMTESGCPMASAVVSFERMGRADGDELRPAFPRRLWTGRRLLVDATGVTEVDGTGRAHAIPYADLLVVEDDDRLYLVHSGHSCVTDVTAFSRGLARIRPRLPARRWRSTIGS